MTGEPDSRPSRTRTQHFVSVLRLAALALVIVGFVGWITEDAAFDLESPYTIAFGVGVACALGSIYLGISLANRDD